MREQGLVYHSCKFDTFVPFLLDFYTSINDQNQKCIIVQTVTCIMISYLCAILLLYQLLQHNCQYRDNDMEFLISVYVTGFGKTRHLATHKDNHLEKDNYLYKTLT